MRILIVEDDPTLADGLTRSLHQSDYAVDCVPDGEQADHVLAAQNFDLVILDWMLPDGQGLDFLRTLRKASIAIPVQASRFWGLDLPGFHFYQSPQKLADAPPARYYVYCPRFSVKPSDIASGWRMVFVSKYWQVYQKI